MNIVIAVEHLLVIFFLCISLNNIIRTFKYLHTLNFVCDRPTNKEILTERIGTVYEIGQFNYLIVSTRCTESCKRHWYLPEQNVSWPIGVSSCVNCSSSIHEYSSVTNVLVSVRESVWQP